MKKILFSIIVSLTLFVSGCHSYKDFSQQEAIELATMHVEGLGIKDSTLYEASLAQENDHLWIVSLYSRGRLFNYVIDRESQKIIQYPIGYGEIVHREGIDQNSGRPLNQGMTTHEQANEIASKEIKGEIIKTKSYLIDDIWVWKVIINSEGMHYELSIDKETGIIIEKEIIK